MGDSAQNLKEDIKPAIIEQEMASSDQENNTDVELSIVNETTINPGSSAGDVTPQMLGNTKLEEKPVIFLVPKLPKDFRKRKMSIQDLDIDKDLENPEVKRILDEGNGIFYSCSTCRNSCNTLKEFNLHARTHVAVQTMYTKMFTCSDCEYTCKKPVSLNRHKVKLHGGRKTHPCDLCDYSTDLSSVLRNHRLRHSLKKLFRCKECGYCSNRVSSISAHKLSHVEGQILQCQLCDYTCNHITALRTHVTSHSVEKFSCDVCDYHSKRASALKIHKIKHQIERPYKCDVCLYACKFAFVLKNHKLAHNSEKMMECGRCDFASLRADKMRSHKLLHSPGLLACDVCTYSCRRMKNMHRHMMKHKDYEGLF